jgi:ribosomal protein S18 acetylase RimI-like enzyme
MLRILGKNMDIIRQIEEISMNCWPALQTVLYDGWVIRFADGFTKRSNSVNPIYHSLLDVDAKIEHCERLYRERGLPVCFKITEKARPAGLDEALSGKGYAREFEISVQLADLEDTLTEGDPAADICESVENEWLENYARMNGLDPARKPALKKILEQIILPKCLLTYSCNDRPAGCGLGVVDGKYLGLFDIVIDKEFRNRGLGKKMMESIMAWGRGQGAERAYLQVLTDNAPAVRLYEKLGFREEYRYWYRVKK